MATMGPFFADSVYSIESMKTEGNSELTYRGAPLPYLIRPRREPPLYNSLCLYNDYVASINDESDEDDSLIEVDETSSSLEKTDCSGLQKESNASLFETGGVPLPYLIRPRKKPPLYDSLCLYNDYVESSMNDGSFYESGEDDSPLEAVDSSSLEKTDCSGLQDKSDASLSETDELSDHSLNDEGDEDYVLVCERKTEKEGTIQMMEISKDIPPPLASDGVSEKDTVDELESEDAGSNNGDWVVV